MKFLLAAVVVACGTSSMMVPSTEAFLPIPSLAANRNTNLFMARSENSMRTEDRRNRGGGDNYNDYSGGGGDYDYSGGNLKYGTGKYTQREGNNDGYQGGVNLSKNGRSMQDSVYREDRERNIDRAMGRDNMPGGDNMYGGRGMDEFGQQGGFRDRMRGGGLLRDLRDSSGRDREDYRETYGYDDFGSPPKVMGGSSKGRGGGYRSNNFQAGIGNGRGGRQQRFEYRGGGNIDDYLYERDSFIRYDNPEGGRRRNMDMMNGGGGRFSNFDRMMGRDPFDEMEARYEMDQYNRDGGRRGNRYNSDEYGGAEDFRSGDRRESYGRDRRESYDRDGYGRGGRGGRGGRRGSGDYYDDNGYGGRDDYGSGGDGRLLRDMRR